MARAPNTRVERELRILEAAVRSFSRHGYHGCTMARVARAAGVADGTLYLYFRSKEDLLVSAFRHVLERLLSRLDQELASIPVPLAKLRRLVEVHLTAMEDEPELASFLQIQLRQPDEAIRRSIAAPLAAYARRIESVLEEGKQAGVIRGDVGTRVMRRVIFGAVDETVSAWLLRAEPGNLADRAGPILELLLGGMATRSSSGV